MKLPSLSQWFEAKKGDSQSAEAEHLFLQALQDSEELGLPVEAFNEIASLGEGDIQLWAQKWKVDAPCVRRMATSWCNGGWAPGLTLASRRGSHLPEEWVAELRALNALQVDGTCQDVLATIISEDAQQRELTRVRKDIEEYERSAPNVDVGELRRARERERYLSVDLPKIRRDRLAQDRVLAPIAADPLRESCVDFLSRAKNHWQARAERARLRGYTQTSTRWEMETHIGWLLRYRLRGETGEAIAGAVNKSPRAVRTAIKSMTDLLGLSGKAKRRK